MRAIIFLNGTPLRKEELDKIDFSDAVILCADGAYSYLKGKIVPSVVLGDFDSCPISSVEKGIETLVFPPEKDFTDGHLAVKLAVEKGTKIIEIYGAFGGRPDHFYSNLSLLLLAKNLGTKASLIGEGFTVTLEEGLIEKSVKIGATVSLVPFNCDAHIIFTEGLKYPMREVTLNREHILGISNEAQNDKIKVECKGELLVFIQTE